MELSFKKIQQLDAHEILEILLPIIDNLYKSVDYIGIIKEDFYNLALNEIDKSKKTYKGDISYIEYIKDRMNIVLVDQIENDLLEPKVAIIIINNYINKHLKKSVAYEDSIKNFKKLGKFFETYNYIPNPDVLIQIIEENMVLSQMIESVMKKHKIQILSGNMEKIFDDNTIILIIETYCMLKNIEIKETEELEKDSIDSENFELADSVKIYLREIDKRPLLTLEEERKLAQRISKGDNSAREIFIESNLKLVVSIASRYIGRGLSFLDLIQEGNIGLITAVDKYDVSRNLKFSTFAIHWIRQAITRAIANKGRNVRVPVYMYEKIGAYKKIVANLEAKLNRQPTINEIANEMGLSVSKVTKLHMLQSDTVYMSTLIGNDKTAELENFIPASEETPEDVVIVSSMQLQVRKLLEDCNLKPREIEILMLRFGFNDRKPMTHEEIGEKFNITGERARQIESIVLMKIRKSKHIKALAEYMHNPDMALKNLYFFREKYSEIGNSNKAFLNNKILEQEKETKSENVPVVSTIPIPSETQNDSKNITKEDCEKVLELLKIQTFDQMMNVLSVKESVIVSLKLGYVDGKYFSTESIAQFLGIEAQEVIDTTKKVLLLYKENVNQFIDNAIDMVTKQPKQLAKNFDN